MVGLTRGQGGAGVGVLPLRARGCLRFGGMGFGRFGRGVGRGISCPVWRGPPPRTREPPDVLVAHQSRTGPPRPLRGRPGGRPVRGRITPAFAGTTMLADTTFCVYAEHPRPRGDHDFTVFNPRRRAGTPPPSRGPPSRPAPSGGLCHLLTHHLSTPSQAPNLRTPLPPRLPTREPTPPGRPPPHPNNRRSFPTATAPARVSTPNFW